MLTSTLFRFVFLPLFLFCNIRPEGRALTWVAFESDTAYIVIMMLFSISNGYVGSICMMSGPQLVKGEEALTAANMMVACLGLGLGLGSFLSNFFASTPSSLIRFKKRQSISQTTDVSKLLQE